MRRSGPEPRPVLVGTVLAAADPRPPGEGPAEQRPAAAASQDQLTAPVRTLAAAAHTLAVRAHSPPADPVRTLLAGHSTAATGATPPTASAAAPTVACRQPAAQPAAC